MWCLINHRDRTYVKLIYNVFYVAKQLNGFVARFVPFSIVAVVVLWINIVMELNNCILPKHIDQQCSSGDGYCKSRLCLFWKYSTPS
jgi:hypothetical protein